MHFSALPVLMHFSWEEKMLPTSAWTLSASELSSGNREDLEIRCYWRYHEKCVVSSTHRKDEASKKGIENTCSAQTKKQFAHKYTGIPSLFLSFWHYPSAACGVSLNLQCRQTKENELQFIVALSFMFIRSYIWTALPCNHGESIQRMRQTYRCVVGMFSFLRATNTCQQCFAVIERPWVCVW